MCDLIDWILVKGGEVTPRDLSRGPTRYRAPGAAEDALQELVDADFGRWVSQPPGSAGGRPTRVFRPNSGDETSVGDEQMGVSSLSPPAEDLEIAAEEGDIIEWTV